MQTNTGKNTKVVNDLIFLGLHGKNLLNVLFDSKTKFVCLDGLL